MVALVERRLVSFHNALRQSENSANWQTLWTVTSKSTCAASSLTQAPTADCLDGFEMQETPQRLLLGRRLTTPSGRLAGPTYILNRRATLQPSFSSLSIQAGPFRTTRSPSGTTCLESIPPISSFNLRQMGQRLPTSFRRPASRPLHRRIGCMLRLV